jgi:8-oxo-dGTP pyrophosphatase MutT (NUDIX family)
MPMIECRTLDGTTKLVRDKELILRPAAYAILVDQGKLLVLRLRHSGKLHLPGGGVHTGERIKDTLKREVKEETGLEIEVGRFAHFEEIFFYFNPSGKAYHGLHFYYICSPLTRQLIEDDRVDDFAAEKPRWVEIADLQPQDFQVHGEAILTICKNIFHD